MNELMRGALLSFLLLLAGCQTCTDGCPNTGLTLTLSSPTTGLANVGDVVRIELDSDLTKATMTCELREAGPAACRENQLVVATELAARGRVFEIRIQTTTHPAHVKITVRRDSDGAVLVGPREVDISYPTISEACSCQGGVDMTMSM